MATIEEVAVSLGSEVSQEYRRAVDVLGKVGLTLYEARAYIALVARGVGDAGPGGGDPEDLRLQGPRVPLAEGLCDPDRGQADPLPPQASARGRRVAEDGDPRGLREARHAPSGRGRPRRAPARLPAERARAGPR